MIIFVLFLLYFPHWSMLFRPPYRTLVDINKSSPCNNLCHCNSLEYDPVCGIDEVSYFSPCHAGCTKRTINEGLKRVTDREVATTLKWFLTLHWKFVGNLVTDRPVDWAGRLACQLTWYTDWLLLPCRRTNQAVDWLAGWPDRLTDCSPADKLTRQLFGSPADLTDWLTVDQRTN